MCSPVNKSSFNVTPSGLFPDKAEASQDKKCLIISKVIQEIIKSCDMTHVTQDVLNDNAKSRYEYLSKEEKLQIYQVDHAALVMYRNGFTKETAKEYYSFRLSEKDSNRWKKL